MRDPSYPFSVLMYVLVEVCRWKKCLPYVVERRSFARLPAPFPTGTAVWDQDVRTGRLQHQRKSNLMGMSELYAVKARGCHIQNCALSGYKICD